MQLGPVRREGVQELRGPLAGLGVALSQDRLDELRVQAHLTVRELPVHPQVARLQTGAEEPGSGLGGQQCLAVEDVAGRVRRCLEFAPADRLALAPDCGLSQTARWAARQKLCSMVDGVRRVREELGIAG